MIKIDMDMPESCVLCPFSIYDKNIYEILEEGHVRCSYAYCRQIDNYEDAASKRAEWCPLKEA